MANKKIGFWKSTGVNYGYLSSPLGYKNGKPIRMRLIKNRYASAEHNRPIYVGWFDDCELDEDYFDEGYKTPFYDKDNECYRNEVGERLYTHDEVQHAINCAASDGARGYSSYGDNIVADYLDE